MKDTIKNTVSSEFLTNDDPIDKCVICGADTPYRFSTPISEREFYVEGSGQICIKCHRKIYITKTGE